MVGEHPKLIICKVMTSFESTVPITNTWNIEAILQEQRRQSVATQSYNTSFMLVDKF